MYWRSSLSNELVSMALAMVAEDRQINDVLEELFAEQVLLFLIKPGTDYTTCLACITSNVLKILPCLLFCHVIKFLSYDKLVDLDQLQFHEYPAAALKNKF